MGRYLSRGPGKRDYTEKCYGLDWHVGTKFSMIEIGDGSNWKEINRIIGKGMNDALTQREIRLAMATLNQPLPLFLEVQYSKAPYSKRVGALQVHAKTDPAIGHYVAPPVNISRTFSSDISENIAKFAKKVARRSTRYLVKPMEDEPEKLKAIWHGLEARVKGELEELITS